MASGVVGVGLAPATSWACAEALALLLAAIYVRQGIRAIRTGRLELGEDRVLEGRKAVRRGWMWAIGGGLWALVVIYAMLRWRGAHPFGAPGRRCP